MDPSEASELDYGGRSGVFSVAFCSVGVLESAEPRRTRHKTLIPSPRKAQGEGGDADAERISYFCHLLFAICHYCPVIEFEFCCNLRS